MPDVNIEDLQRAARAIWGVDYPAALRLATGITSDPNGIARQLGLTDLNMSGYGTDTLLEILTEATQAEGYGATASAANYTKRLITLEATRDTNVSVVSSRLRAGPSTAATAHTSAMRHAWTRNGVTSADVEAMVQVAIPNWNFDTGGGNVINPSGGLCLRLTEDGTRRRAIFVANNVGYSLAFVQVRVVSCLLDGTGYIERSASLPALGMPPFPYWIKARLVGNMLDFWNWGSAEQWPDGNPDRYLRVNLDTQVGTVVAGNETPTGVGAHGVVGCFIGSHANAFIDYPNLIIRPID